VVDHAYLTGRIAAPMGWQMIVGSQTKPRTLLNWMMQAAGGELLRAAVVKLSRAGFAICATAHDSVMLQVPLDRLADRVRHAQEIMERCSLSLTRGILVRTKAQIVLPGERLLTKKTRPTWDRINALIDAKRPLAPAKRLAFYLECCRRQSLIIAGVACSG
jgi:hypothetical protein